MNNNYDNEDGPVPAPKPARLTPATRKATLVGLLADVYASAGLGLRDANAAALADYVCSFRNSGAGETRNRVEAGAATCA